MDKRSRRGKYIVSDIAAASFAWLVFNILRYHEVAVYTGFHTLQSYLSFYQVWKGQLLIPAFWLALFYFSGYYNKPVDKSRLAELFSTLVTVATGVVLIFFIIVLDDLPQSFRIYYELFFVLFILQFVFTYVPRLAITQAGINRRMRREWSPHLLIVGTGEKARQTADGLYLSGYTIAGFVPGGKNDAVKVDAGRVLGTIEELPGIIQAHTIDELIVAVETDESKEQLSVLYNLCHYKLPVKVLAGNPNLLTKFNIKKIQGALLVDLTDNNFSEAGKNIKLFMDKVFSLLALILLSPLFPYIARRVKKDSPGPVLFRQERIGYRGKPFTIYKFRTMYTDAEENGPLLSAGNDPRITPFGFFMRKYRLDELPQFWNVLKGDMSLVGPRPERRYFIERIVKQAPYYYLLHNIRPGITSLGMVKYGYAANVDQMIERLKYDIMYYENMSLVLDITILIYTVKTVATGKGI